MWCFCKTGSIFVCVSHINRQASEIACLTKTSHKTVNFDEWFESLESFINIFLNLWIWMSRRMNQTYFEWYEFDINVVLMLIATYTYKSMLNWVLMNKSSWYFNTVDSLILKITWVLMSSEKTIHCWSLLCTYVWYLEKESYVLIIALKVSKCRVKPA